ncbi:hypothetical protein BDQ17DRAFT_1392762 [Cyathus striatus]|nr:hypothetical protein BDQ17DRAFT_1392762 [Cyathus striatus]
MSPRPRRKSIDSSSSSSSDSSSDSSHDHNKRNKEKDKKNKKHKKDKRESSHGVSSSYGYAQAPPPSGYRIPLTSDSSFPEPLRSGEPPCRDLNGAPVYIGSALFESSVHPCKIGPHLSPPASVPYGGAEHAHRGRYDLLPFVPEQMEFVRTSGGQIPQGRQNGSKLYHAVAEINGVRVPGKTGEHLGGCNVPFGGTEHIVRDNYEVLCWK